MRTGDKPRILVTAGEPAGIGPDLVIKLSQISHDYDLTVIGDPDLLKERAECLSIPLDIISVSNSDVQQNLSNHKSLKVLPVKLRTPAIPGVLDTRNASYVLEMLDIACIECLGHNFDAIVTTPLQKSVINDAGIAFSGHTEYLAEKCGGSFPVMLLACPDLRVALVTTHLPLRDVPDAISHERVEKVIRIVLDEMTSRFGIKNPRITVCGLNPHAGEDGYLGTEEITSITPAINDFINSGYNIAGPLPADTAFRLEQRQKTDVFICMYHDQGLPVLKTLGFGKAVNITLGLPIIRTSVDHGTALTLAGTGKAQCNSLLAAIDMADKMANHQFSNTPVTSITIDEI
jgi:4-hydroxythreonine-4-phosphate dehydrogenase